MKKEKTELKKDNEVSAIDFERVSEILQLKDKIQRLEFDIDARHQLKLLLEGEIEKLEEENKKLNKQIEQFKKGGKAGTKIIERLEEENKKLKERIDVLYEFIERNDKLVDEVIDEEDLDKLNRYIYIDDDLVDRTLESED